MCSNFRGIFEDLSLKPESLPPKKTLFVIIKFKKVFFSGLVSTDERIQDKALMKYYNKLNKMSTNMKASILYVKPLSIIGFQLFIAFRKNIGKMVA